MNPTPEWATSTARRKRRRADSDAGGDDVRGVDLDTLVTSSGGILGHRRRTRLDPGVLSIERLRDANQAAQAEGEVNAIQFHPSPQVSMLLTASSDRRIRLFNVRACSSVPSSPPPTLISKLALTSKKHIHRLMGTRTHACKHFTSLRYQSPTRSSTPVAHRFFSLATVRSITHTICNLGQQRVRREGCGEQRLQMATTTRTSAWRRALSTPAEMFLRSPGAVGTCTWSTGAPVGARQSEVSRQTRV
jgi:WD40 repeat protein